MYTFGQTGSLKPRPVTEYFNYKTLDQVFDTLINKFDFKITYDQAEVNKSRFSYSFNNTFPDNVMKICLRETALKFVIELDGTYKVYNPLKENMDQTTMKPTIAAKRKNIAIKGIVKDSKSGETLPYVNIFVPGTNKGTATNVDGYFTLFDIPSDTSCLELSYIGYQSRLFYLSPDLDIENIKISLEAQSELLSVVEITATREELLRANEKISMLKLSPAKIISLPAVGERDVMRSFQLMPGVSAANENSSGLYVRGGTPDQTLVTFDGFSVYHVDHLFGFFSAFNPNAIKDVQLFKGGFESKFGGRLSSVAEITGKEGSSNNPNLSINAGFLASNAAVEFPISDKITTLFAYR